MKIITTNDAHCKHCFYYRLPREDENCMADGFCEKKTRPCGKNVHWSNYCREWEHKETRITHFEVMTGEPEPKRSEAEREYILKLLGKVTGEKNG